MKFKTNNPSIIRIPKINEFSKICRLLNHADLPYKKFIPDYEPFTVDDLRYMKNKSKKSFLVIDYCKKLSGLAVWSIKNQKICWLSILHIDPSKQKLGLGTTLLNKIEKIAQKRNCVYCMLELFPQAYWAKKFYFKNHYHILPKKQYKKKIFEDILSTKTKTLVMIKKIKKEG